MGRGRIRIRTSGTRGKGGTAAWIKENAGTAKFKALIRAALRPYMIALKKHLVAQYKKAGNTFNYESFKISGGPWTTVTSTTLEFRQWVAEKGSYKRAHGLGGRRVKAKSGFSPKSDKFQISGKLKAVVTNPKVVIKGTSVRILTPHYIEDFKELDPTKGNVTVNLSRVLESRFPKAQHTRVPPKFLKKGAMYEAAKQRILDAIAIEAGKATGKAKTTRKSRRRK